MCYIILARSIKRGFKTGVNLLRQVCTFVLSPFFMQKNVNKIHNSCINIKNMQIRLYIRKKVAIM